MSGSVDASSALKRRNINSTGIDEPIPKPEIQSNNEREKDKYNLKSTSNVSTTIRKRQGTIATVFFTIALTIAAIITRYYNISNGNFVL